MLSGGCLLSTKRHRNLGVVVTRTWTRQELLQNKTVQTLLQQCTFPAPGTPISCGVSGGPDSTALLVLAVASGCRVTAEHVDHQLREESHKEAFLVEKTAKSLGAGFVGHSVRVEAGPNLEARAREARYGVLPFGVATGHTMEDQAETVLLNLLRGAGPAGLRGIEPGYRHPILALRRADTVELCETLGIETFHDPSNSQTIYRRNQVRHLVIPLLCDVAQRDIVPMLARSADLVRDTYKFFDATASSLIDDPTDTRKLLGVDEVVARHALYRWLKTVTPEGKTLDAATVDRVMGVVRGDNVATQLPGGLTLKRTKGKLEIMGVETKKT